MLYKVAAVLLVFLGEATSVTAELFASKNAGSGHFAQTFFQMSLLMMLGGILLVSGYMLGYLYLKNIWAIVVTSLATLAIGEPLLALLLFGETPTTGAFIGLVLAILALLSAFLIP